MTVNHLHCLSSDLIDDEILRWIEWSLEERPVDDRALDVNEIEHRSVLQGMAQLDDP